MEKKRVYAAIDLKSFYASVECVERGLDPLSANLVVADLSRTEKTICLAVSPSLKKLGVGGRCRIFELNQKIREYEEKTGRKVEYVAAPPRMQKYIDYSARIYSLYLDYVSSDDIHVYSIDEVFIDLTGYLSMYSKSAEEIVRLMLRDVYQATGITATAGIGDNLFLAKVAMDIVAKRSPADEYGTRIALLDEMSFRRKLWTHKPITDFWRFGQGLSRRLARYGMYTMGDIALMSLEYEDLLYREFGVDAELMIDHAWGRESCSMEDIKKYKPRTSSISSGQVLSCPYDFEKARIVVSEMMDSLSLELVEKDLVCTGVSLMIGFDIEGVATSTREVVKDFYGRMLPKPVTVASHLRDGNGEVLYSSSTRRLLKLCLSLYDTHVPRNLPIKRMSITCLDTISRTEVPTSRQLYLFDSPSLEEDEAERKEESIQHALLDIKKKWGKNAILKGFSYEEGSTQKERNSQIGGHHA